MSEDFINIRKNKILECKLLKIINEKDKEKAKEECQDLLQYINTSLIEKKFNIKLKEYYFTDILNKYAEIDQFLYKKMVYMNSMYELLGEKKINDSDIRALLIEIDAVYRYMIEKYGEIII